MSTLELLAIASLVVQVVIAPALWKVSALLWEHERRLTRCETKLNINPQEM